MHSIRGCLLPDQSVRADLTSCSWLLLREFSKAFPPLDGDKGTRDSNEEEDESSADTGANATISSLATTLGPTKTASRRIIDDTVSDDDVSVTEPDSHFGIDEHGNNDADTEAESTEPWTPPGCQPGSGGEELVLPHFTFEETRRIMTRTDFIDPLDILHVSSDIHEEFC